MNSYSDEQLAQYENATLTPEEELLVERLVDGELLDDEREELLYRLDEKVDGWRFCALSFLENQTFQSALKSAIEKPLARKVHNQLTNLPSHSKLNYWLSAAAGFLVAVVMIGGFLNFHDASQLDVAIDEIASSDQPQLASLEQYPATETTTSSSPTAPTPAETNSGARDMLLADSVIPRTVVLNNPARGLSNVATPCSKVNSYDHESFQFANSVIPQEVVNHMYNVGGSIDSHRDEYRFPIDDKHVLIVPVDTYNVKSGGNRQIW
ncbi:MAG: hypothetical protein ACOX0A_03345 [Thermoguttaceae bacterium]|jgi:hypothetical protein